MDRAVPDTRYRALVRSVPQTVLAVFDSDLKLTLAEGTALDGLAGEFTEGSRLADLIPEDRRAEAVAAARLACAGKTVQFEYASGSGRTWAVDLGPCVGADGKADGIVWVARDASASKAAEEELTHRALHDPLTGLANRELFMDRLQQALGRLTRHESILAVVFIDLDRLKAVNDSLGHAVGDQVLIHAAQRIRQALRPTDTVARFGGDEFVVLCEDVNSESDAERVAHRLAAVLARPLIIESQEFQVTASMGVKTATDPGADADAVVRDADAAMYRAKHRGRAGFQVFDEAMRMSPTDRERVESGLRRALAMDQLAVVYQPQVELGDLSVVGAEALLRWMKPDGMADPGTFLAIAEEAGLMRPIGDWVITRVCRDLAAWPADLRASINLSPNELADDELVDRAAQIAENAEVDPSRICFEVSEASLFTEAERGVARVAQLRDHGFMVAIDDFGVGYSSLHHLRHLPQVDLLKLDRAFVSGLGTNARDGAIVASVILLTNALGMLALGEGVETDLQAGYLRGMGCDLAQGFWFGRPQPVDDFIAGVAELA